MLYQLQRYDRAAEAYERCLRLDDRSARVSYKLALARYRDGDIDGALAALDRGHRGSTIGWPTRYYLLGLCLREKRGRRRGAAGAREGRGARRPA